MKRDLDLAREILIQIEANPNADGSSGIDIQIPGRSDRKVSYHVKLLDDAGLIDMFDLNADDECQYVPRRLTNSGHDFLDAYRQETVWNKAKQFIKDKAMPATLDALFPVAVAYIRSGLGIPGGDGRGPSSSPRLHVEQFPGSAHVGPRCRRPRSVGDAG